MERSDVVQGVSPDCIEDSVVRFGWQGGDTACQHVAYRCKYEVRSEVDDSRPQLLVDAVFTIAPAAPREIAVLALCDCGAKVLMGRERYAPGVRAGFAPDLCY